MNFDLLLAGSDTARVQRSLDKLARCDLNNFAVTGRLALEAHRIRLGLPSHRHPLNDLDIVVESFASIPEALAGDFLVRHIHAHAPEGKMLVQLVDPDASLRIDIFRAYGATMTRSQSFEFGTNRIRVVSLEDLASRSASLLMDLEGGVAVARKHARDFEFLSQAVDCNRVEVAWRDHRKSTDPLTFEEVRNRIRNLVESRGGLLVIREYSRDVCALCPKCRETGPFRLASPATILSILGYC